MPVFPSRDGEYVYSPKEICWPLSYRGKKGNKNIDAGQSCYCKLLLRISNTDIEVYQAPVGLRLSFKCWYVEWFWVEVFGSTIFDMRLDCVEVSMVSMAQLADLICIWLILWLGIFHHPVQVESDGEKDLFYWPTAGFINPYSLWLPNEGGWIFHCNWCSCKRGASKIRKANRSLRLTSWHHQTLLESSWLDRHSTNGIEGKISRPKHWPHYMLWIYAACTGRKPAPIQ